MNFADAVVTCFKKYITVSGRAPRSEYWWFWLFCIVVNCVATVADGPQPPEGKYAGGVLSAIWSLITLLPFIMVGVRRLHDIDKSGWWLLAPLGVVIIGTLGTPFVAALLGAIGVILMSVFVLIVLIVVCLLWFVRKGTPGPNRFGPDPLA